MNKGEIKAVLAKLDREGVSDSIDVFITQATTDFSVSLAENAAVTEIAFSEGKDRGPKAKDKVLLITDEP